MKELEKENLKKIIEIFIDKWNNTKGMWKNEFFGNLNSKFGEYKIHISFGSGNRSKYPTIYFLKDDNKASNGIYPFIDYIYNNKLEIGLGVSYDKEPNIDENIIKYIHNYELNEFNLNEIDLLIEQLIKNIKNFELILSSNKSKEGILVMQQNNQQIQPLNQILYGCPGTGKTYNTINKALEIILEKENNDEIKEILEKDNPSKIERTKLKEKFEEYKKAGQIEFVTFHQSYGYEEFVEGIKAETNKETKNVEYDIKAGIFKKLCEKASQKADITPLDFGKPNKTWKMSLGKSGSKEAKDIRKYCFDNNVICLGFWISDILFKGKNGEEIFAEMEEAHNKNPDKYPKNSDTKIESANKTSRIVNEMQKDDIVLVSGDNLKTISGIAKITGNYELLTNIDNDLPDYMVNFGFEQCRKVKWLVKNVEIPVDNYLREGNIQLGRGTIISNNTIDLEKLKKAIIKSNTDKNYVLIIDEINRGNISKIFGELITLIEDSKRIGAKEEIKVKLPYSGDKEEPFGVPQNLYIIGTMNTADRSIALLDTALRRRFHFVEMMPDLEVLENIKIGEIEIPKLLETINKRIEYLYDRDHIIGHAYFMSLQENPTLKDLENIFRNKIIPLLQEYFYDDWEKIRMVLGDGFVDKKEVKKDIFDIEFKDSEYVEENKYIYFIKDEFDYSKLK